MRDHSIIILFDVNMRDYSMIILFDVSMRNSIIILFDVSIIILFDVSMRDHSIIMLFDVSMCDQYYGYEFLNATKLNNMENVYINKKRSFIIFSL